MGVIQLVAMLLNTAIDRSCELVYLKKYVKLDWGAVTVYFRMLKLKKLPMNECSVMAQCLLDTLGTLLLKIKNASGWIGFQLLYVAFKRCCNFLQKAKLVNLQSTLQLCSNDLFSRRFELFSESDMEPKRQFSYSTPHREALLNVNRCSVQEQALSNLTSTPPHPSEPLRITQQS